LPPKDLESGTTDASLGSSSVPGDEAKEGDAVELDTYGHEDAPALHGILERADRPTSLVTEEPRRVVSWAHDTRDGGEESPGAGSSREVPAAVPRPRPQPGRTGDSAGDKDVMPDAIGRETCPICIVDFEEGDDLRVLPCEGHHRFHQECVDQWLLELSSSCPLCRQDFHALETLMAGDMGDPLEPPRMPGASRPLSSAGARFSRYLRLARRRQRGRREDPFGYDPTNPPMPIAADTRL